VTYGNQIRFDVAYFFCNFQPIYIFVKKIKIRNTIIIRRYCIRRRRADFCAQRRGFRHVLRFCCCSRVLKTVYRARPGRGLKNEQFRSYSYVTTANATLWPRRNCNVNAEANFRKLAGHSWFYDLFYMSSCFTRERFKLLFK